MAEHPLVERAKNFGIHHERYQTAQRLAGEFEQRFATLAAMSRDTANASIVHGLLCSTTALLSIATTDFGPIHGWTRSVHAKISAEANRLLPPGHGFTGPNWIE